MTMMFRLPQGHRVPAVVVGAAGACGLGLVRSLGPAGVPVIVVDDDPLAPAMHSRHARPLLAPRIGGAPLCRVLLDLAAALGERAVLFPTSDEVAATISEHRAELAAHYRFTLPDHDLLGELAHKRSFHRLAAESGFPVPRSIAVRGAADLDRLDDFPFPAIVKPAVKTAAYVDHGYPRAYKVHSAGEAAATCRRILPVLPDLLVQEWIAGGDEHLYFCLQYRAADGTTVCSFTGRKLSIWPPDVGVTASCTAAADADPVLRPLTEAFFRRVSFVGMGGIEYKKDAASGRFLMIEPTVGRVDGQAEVAAINGANLPLAAYLHETGEPVPAVAPPNAPAIWRNGFSHWRAVRRGAPRSAGIPGARIYDAFWRREDPVPAAYFVLGGLAKALRRTRRRDRARQLRADKALATAVDVASVPGAGAT